MNLLHTLHKHTYSSLLFVCAWCYTSLAHAQLNFTSDPIYSGGGIEEGVDEAGTIVGENSLRDKVITIVETILSYLALVAVIVIIIAGIRLVISQGEEEQKEKAKRTILYAIIGLFVILLARALVGIVIEAGNA